MNAIPPRAGHTLAPGATVRILKQPPYYLRGAKGEIAEVRGLFRDPSLLAFHKPGLPMRILYRVKFKQVDVWPNYAGSKNDTVVADIYEHWIEAIAGETK